MAGSAWIPLSATATTKGDAEALVDALFANAKVLELKGTSIPKLLEISIKIGSLVRVRRTAGLKECRT